MQINTTRERIKEQIGWIVQGCGDWHKRGEETLNKIKALDPNTCSPKDLTDIIGWEPECVMQQCGECDQFVDAVVEIGEASDFESATAYVCKDCLKKALQMLEEA